MALLSEPISAILALASSSRVVRPSSTLVIVAESPVAMREIVEARSPAAWMVVRRAVRSEGFVVSWDMLSQKASFASESVVLPVSPSCPSAIASVSWRELAWAATPALATSRTPRSRSVARETLAACTPVPIQSPRRWIGSVVVCTSLRLEYPVVPTFAMFCAVTSMPAEAAARPRRPTWMVSRRPI